MTDFSKMKIALPQVNLDHLEIEKYLEINVDNLEETLQHQPSLYCTFGMIAREAERQLAEVKASIDIAESAIKLDQYTRCRLEGRKISKEELSSQYSASPNLVELEAKKRQLAHAAATFVTIEESFKQRFGMVQQIAKRRSNELSQLNQAP